VGYYSDAYGEITLFKNTSVKEFEDFCDSEGIQYSGKIDITDRVIHINLQDWKIDKESIVFKELSKFGSFELEIKGSDGGDVWELRGNKGKIEALYTTLIWDKEWTVINETKKIR